MMGVDRAGVGSHHQWPFGKLVNSDSLSGGKGLFSMHDRGGDIAEERSV